jgi:hypothetical protein
MINANIVLDNHSVISSDYTILACENNVLQREKPIPWKSCETLYFETEDRLIKRRMIGLIPVKEALINNVFYVTCIDSSCHSSREVLSVTIINDNELSKDELVDRARKELKEYCGISTIKLIKHYSIPYALPDLLNVQYEKRPNQTKGKKGVFLAGDVQLNGSLNAAIISGENAALGLLNSMEY